MNYKKIKAFKLRDAFDRAVQWGATISLSVLSQLTTVGTEDLIFNAAIHLLAAKFVVVPIYDSLISSRLSHSVKWLPEDHPVNVAIDKCSDAFNLTHSPRAFSLPKDKFNKGKSVFHLGASSRHIELMGHIPEYLSQEGLEAIVTHEMAHLEHKDMKNEFADLFLGIMIAYGLIVNLSFPTVLSSAGVIGLTWIIFAQSWQAQERRADRKAVEITLAPETYLDALDAVVKSNPSIKRRDTLEQKYIWARVLRRIFSDHPPMTDRRKQIKKMAATLKKSAPEL